LTKSAVETLRLDRPMTAVYSAAMTSATEEMHGTARLAIREGKLEEFKRLVAEAMEVVRTKDPGTIEYNVYLNADGTEAFVHERYRDSAAGMAHSANISSLMQAFLDVATITGEVCGNPSPELRQALEGSGVKIYTPLQSLAR
jgi:quinol monooxygenase YgiN